MLKYEINDRRWPKQNWVAALVHSSNESFSRRRFATLLSDDFNDTDENNSHPLSALSLTEADKNFNYSLPQNYFCMFSVKR